MEKEVKVKKKISKKAWIFIALSATIVVLAIFTINIYNAWKNPVGAFIKDAMSQNAQINVPSQVPQVDENGQQTGQNKTEPNAQSSEFQNQNIVNILLMGIDTSEARDA